MIEPKQISKIRKNLNLTQNQLSKLSGISQSLITKIEQGKINPSFETIKKISQSLNYLEEKNSKKAKDLMTPKIVSVKPNEKIEEIIRIMKKHNISQTLVIDTHVVGIITENNIIENIGLKNKILAKDIMSNSPPIIEIDTPEKIIIELLKFYPLIIIKDKNLLKGVITKSNILELIRN